MDSTNATKCRLVVALWLGVGVAVSACSAGGDDAEEGHGPPSSTSGQATSGAAPVPEVPPVVSGAGGSQSSASGGQRSTTSGAGGGAGGSGGQAGGAAGSSALGGGAGAPSSTGGAPTTGGESGGSTGSAAGDRSGPLLPPIEGDCPTFKSGTATIGGLAGISLQVGERKQGTGSLVFYWHGTGSSAAEVNAFLPAAVRQEILGGGGIIVAFGGSTQTGGDCSGTNTFSKDDFKIADLIAACAVRDYGIEPRRIYATGCSAGGLQAGCMGALRSSYVAAVVPNSGGLVFNQPIQDATRTPAVMTMHGGSSDQVVVAFSQTSATYDKLMKGAGSFVVNCNHGGGHCAAPAKLYTAGWEFMKAHPFGATPEPYASGLPESFPDYCSVY